ncbi:TetR/AcrR family transcriptional regulator [Gordonia sp. CPCC 205515]|uniref:TetR/AcrR family transcriptional regulator n=1 Tax=Gordonia sp. CPCC 205515 TaxID=3140791 RepID=UPI003AF399C5
MAEQRASKLTADAIVATAIDVADADGLSALSMRRIADDLGVGAMSLYRHVADKDALLEAMAEEIGRRFPYPVHDDGPWTWRQRVAIAVDIDWDLYRQHPWVVLAYSAPRYSFGLDALEGLDWLAAGFLDLGVDIVRATEMALSLWNYVNGVVLATVSEQFLGTERPGDRPSGLADLIDGRTAPHLPHLAGLASASGAARLTDPRALLDAGVAALCAGFEATAG